VTSFPLPRRKKARTGGEGDSYDPYDFSDAEEEMPEGESLGFRWHLAPEGAAAFCPGGSVPLGSSDAMGSLVWCHPTPPIKANFF